LLALATCWLGARAETITIEALTLPEALAMNSVFFVDPNQGYIIGNEGKVALTMDAGKTWSVITLSTTANLRGIYFCDKNNGWVAGDSGVIFRTQDGGYKWALQKSGITTDLESVWFAHGKRGWATFKKADKGHLGIQTFDGGESWKPFNLPCGTSFFRPKIESEGSAVRIFGKIDEKKLKYIRTDDKGGSWRVMTEDIYRPKQVGEAAPLMPFTDYWPRITGMVDNQKEVLLLSEENKFYSYDKEMKKWIAGDREGIGLTRLANGGIVEIETEKINCQEKSKDAAPADMSLRFCFKQGVLFAPKEGLNTKAVLPDLETDGLGPLPQYVIRPIGPNVAIAFFDGMASKTVKLIKIEASPAPATP
jgi:hypothetical protein